MGIDGPIIEPATSSERVIFNGVVPALPDHATRFVVAEEPIVSGGVGRVRAAGVCLAYVNIQTDGDTRAGIATGDAAKLTSGAGPVEILHPVSGVTGETLCIVRLNSADSPVLARVTLVDQSALELSAVEVYRDGEDNGPGRVWDGGSPPNLPKIKPLNLHDLPLVDDIVEVFVGDDSNGSEAVWSCVTRNQPVRAKVASVDPKARTITATGVTPNGTPRTDGRRFGTIGVESARMPEIGDKLILGYGYNATGDAEWFILNATEAAEVLAYVTGSNSGSVDWEEVSAEMFQPITDRLTGSSALPLGWQEMSIGSIVTLQPGPNDGFGVTSLGPGVEGVSNPFDEAVEVRNSVLPSSPQWSMNNQGATVGIKAIELGNLYDFDPKGCAVDRYDTIYTSDGVLSNRNYRDSVRLTGDAEVSPALIGHIGMEPLSDDFGDRTWRLYLALPLSDTEYTLNMQVVATGDATGGGTIPIMFDSAGRYNGGDATQVITIDVDTSGGAGGGGHTAIVGSEHIEATGAAGGTYTISLKPPQATATTARFEWNDSGPDDLITVTDFDPLKFDNSGRLSESPPGFKATLFAEYVEFDRLVGIQVTFEVMEVTTQRVRVCGREIGDPVTTTVIGVTDCSES